MTHQGTKSQRSSSSVEEEIIAMSVHNFERMPMLDLIFERFEVSLAKAFRSFTSTPTEAELIDVDYTTYGSAMMSVDSPCMVGIAEILPWHGPVAIPMDARFLYSALEVVMGGKPTGESEKSIRGFTRIEMRIAHRLCELALEDLSESFAQVVDLSFEIKRMEGNAQLATITQPSSACVKADFKVSFGDSPGTLSIILPHGSLTPVRDQLTKVFYGEKLGGDMEWRSHLTDRISSSTLPVTAVLSELDTTLAEVLNWQTGQTIDLMRLEEDAATIMCAGVAIARGPTGRCANGTIAVRVTENLGALNAIGPLLGLDEIPQKLPNKGK